MNAKIEFMPWYHPGAELMRCGGDDGCGATLVEGDIELHRKFHAKVEELLEHARSIHPVAAQPRVIPWCNRTECLGLPRHPGHHLPMTGD